MALSDKELRSLRYLLRKADAADLLSRFPPPRRGCRNAKYDDVRWVPGLAMFVEVAKRERGMTETAALRWMANAVAVQGKLASSANALVARWRKALRRNARWLDPLWPLGVDPARFTLKPLKPKRRR